MSFEELPQALALNDVDFDKSYLNLVVEGEDGTEEYAIAKTDYELELLGPYREIDGYHKAPINRLTFYNPVVMRPHEIEHIVFQAGKNTVFKDIRTRKIVSLKVRKWTISQKLIKGGVTND